MLLKHYKKHFFDSLKNIQDEQEIESFFFILTEYLLHLKRVDVALNPDFEISDAAIEKWNAILSELQQEKPIEYFTQVVPWKYLTGVPDSELVIYPFGLHSPGTQPDGSINSSRIKLFQVDLIVNPLPSNTLYQYDFGIFVENYNWVNIASGMGGLKYAL